MTCLSNQVAQVTRGFYNFFYSQKNKKVLNRQCHLCHYLGKLSRQRLSSKPQATNPRSICLSSLQISRPLAAFARRFSSLSFVNFP